MYSLSARIIRPDFPLSWEEGRVIIRGILSDSLKPKIEVSDDRNTPALSHHHN